MKWNGDLTSLWIRHCKSYVLKRRTGNQTTFGKFQRISFFHLNFKFQNWMEFISITIPLSTQASSQINLITIWNILLSQIKLNPFWIRHKTSTTQSLLDKTRFNFICLMSRFEENFERKTFEKIISEKRLVQREILHWMGEV